MNYDGEIVLGTRVDTKGIDDGIKNIRKLTKKYLTTEIEVPEVNIKQIEKSKNLISKYREELDKIAFSCTELSTKIEKLNKGLSMDKAEGIDYLKEKFEDLKKLSDKDVLTSAKGKLDNLTNQVNLLREQEIELNKQINIEDQLAWKEQKILDHYKTELNLKNQMIFNMLSELRKAEMRGEIIKKTTSQEEEQLKTVQKIAEEEEKIQEIPKKDELIDEDGLAILEKMYNYRKKLEEESLDYASDGETPIIKEKISLYEELLRIVQQLKGISNVGEDNGAITDYAITINQIENSLDSLDKKQKQVSKNAKDDFSILGNKLDEVFGGLGKKIEGIYGILEKKTKDITKGMKDVMKKGLKWILVLSGVKKMYSLLQDAANNVGSSNEKLGKQIDNMKKALSISIGAVFEPILQRVVKTISTITYFIGQLIKQLTGRDIFASMSDSLSSGAGSAKEIKKQLAGFDEMNVLSGNDGSSGGGGASTDTGIELEPLNEKLLEILNKIKDLVMAKEWGQLGEYLSTTIISGLDKVINKIKSIPWQDIGRGISDFLVNIDFSGLLTKLVSIFGEAVLGLQTLLLEIDWGTVVGNLSQGIADAFSTMSDYIDKMNWEKMGEKITDVIENLKWGEIVSSILDTLWSTFTGLEELFSSIDWEKVGESLSTNLHTVFNKIIEISKSTDWEQIGRDLVDAIINFVKGVDWWQLAKDILSAMWEGLTSNLKLITGVFEGLFKAILEIFGIDTSGIPKFSEMGKQIINDLVKGIKSLISSVINTFQNLWNGIKNVFSSVGEFFYNIFNKVWTTVSNVIDRIKGAFQSVKDFIGGIVNGIWSGIKSVINSIINGMNKLIRGLNKISFDTPDWIPVIGGKKWGFNIKEIKTLASGAIINQPGRGIPVGGNAIGGEAGREGILPLTDSRAMAELGREIGRWITLNANIPVSIGNRQIARIVKQLMADEDFATNS